MATGVCFCTLAVHAPYRQRARRLCGDAPSMPWVVLTDDPGDFADLPVRAVRHTPTGPMAADYVQRIGPTGQNRGAAAYHDKRFAVSAALEHHETAVFFDADSRLGALPLPGAFPPGLSAVPFVHESIAVHLDTCGSWRLPAFEQLAKELTGDTNVLQTAWWCHETCYAVTKDGREARFFDAWGQAAGRLAQLGVFSGEGGVMGLAAACAGWAVDFDALAPLFAAIEHEGGGPKHP